MPEMGKMEKFPLAFSIPASRLVAMSLSRVKLPSLIRNATTSDRQEAGLAKDSTLGQSETEKSLVPIWISFELEIS